MTKLCRALAGALGLVAIVWSASSTAFLAPAPSAHSEANVVTGTVPQAPPGASLLGRHSAAASWCSWAVGGGLAVAAVTLAAVRTGRARTTTRVVALRASSEDGDVEAFVRQAVAGVASAVVLAGSAASPATAYPIFAQQNYAEPEEATGKIVCANCHLARKPMVVRNPHTVLPDTIFKATLDIPLKYDIRRQPIASGEKGELNVGAVAIMPEGWKLAPKDRLPKVLKKQMKGLAWAQYSKEKPNIVVAGPVPGKSYSLMTLPILAPNPEASKDVIYDKYTFAFGGNRGRGQVYPEGNQSNNNQFFAEATGKVSAIDGTKVTVQKDDGTTSTTDCLPGATVVVEVGESVKEGDPITTNPNVGGFGQVEREIVLQDMNRTRAYCAFSISIFLAQLSFILKKKQFEKVQLAEGF